MSAPSEFRCPDCDTVNRHPDDVAHGRCHGCRRWVTGAEAGYVGAHADAMLRNLLTSREALRRLVEHVRLCQDASLGGVDLFVAVGSAVANDTSSTGDGNAQLVAVVALAAVAAIALADAEIAAEEGAAGPLTNS